MSNASGGASITTASATGTIQNDDTLPPPTLAIAATDANKAEGDSGTTAFTFTVTRSGDTSGTTTVDFATSDGTAIAGADYNANTGTLTFNPGEASKTIIVDVIGETLVETDETFSVTLSNASGGASITTASADGTIQNDDTAGVTITETSGSTNVTEGGATDTYIVVLDAQPTGNVIVNITPDSQTNVDVPSLTFTDANWDTPQTVTVTADDDLTAEGDHSSTITHEIAPSSAPGYPGVSISNVAVTITDNDFNDIISGPGGQTLTGTAVPDRFIYNSIFDGGDTIDNFTNIDDKIDISGVLSQIGYSGSDPIADSYLSFQAFGSHTIIMLDIDGSATRGVPRGFLLVENITPGNLNNLDNFIIS